jgi:hypothetical protein
MHDVANTKVRQWTRSWCSCPTKWICQTFVSILSSCVLFEARDLYHDITPLLTVSYGRENNSMSKVLVAHIGKTLLACFGTLKFITVLTITRNWAPFWASSVNSRIVTSYFRKIEALCYKSEGRGFENRWGEWISSIYRILLAQLGPGVYSASNRNGYQKQKNNVSGE